MSRRARVPNVSIEALRRAREQTDGIGRLGEELVAIHLEHQKKLGVIASFEWVSEINAVAPMDFRLSPIAGVVERIDVKTTTGTFDRPIHISLSELREMAVEPDGPYLIYRVYAAAGDGAKLRISNNMKNCAQTVLSSLVGIPAGVIVDAVSVDPGGITFDDEMPLASADEAEE